LACATPGHAVVDITPGTREGLAICLLAARASGARIVYVKHQNIEKTNSIQYGTEELINLDLSDRPSP